MKEGDLLCGVSKDGGGTFWSSAGAVQERCGSLTDCLNDALLYRCLEVTSCLLLPQKRAFEGVWRKLNMKLTSYLYA